MSRHTILIASLSLCLSLAVSASASGKTRPSIALQSTPEWKVFVYGFPGLSSPVVKGAETEADSILRASTIHLQWIDCTSPVLPSPCQLPQAPTDLIIRFIAKPLPQASAEALGIAGPVGDLAAAFIFYDRIVALRGHNRMLSTMIGRVLAHEITHLLVPQESHTTFGLMRGQWSIDDLSVTSAACRGLSVRAVQRMHGEALRKMGIKPATLDK